MGKPQLFLLHFAGGNRYSFQFMKSFLKEFELVPLELPGRGRRYDEILLKDFDSASFDLKQQIMTQLKSTDFIIYGHSMGAYLALRVSSLIENEGKYPVAVFVSGNAGPGMKDNTSHHLLDSASFMDELIKLGGIPEDFINDKELLQYYEPILRADFEIIETNTFDLEPVICAPIFALMGSFEKKVNEINNWSNFTKSSFDYKILEGNHFFIYRHAEKIASIIDTQFNTIKSKLLT